MRWIKPLSFSVLAFLTGSLSLRCFGQFQNAVPIPDTLSGTNFQLTLTAGQKAILPGPLTPTLSYNQFGYLGPTLIMRKGDNINAMIVNGYTDTTTFHWHGLHLPAHSDGGPHNAILPNAMWHSHYTVRNKAGTYWYHPHFHGKTGEQTLKGAAGFILVRDSEEGSLPLPRTYGKDDFPLVIQSQEFSPANTVLHKGMRDSIVLVNGVIRPFLSVPAQWVRLRLLNGSNARNFLIGLEGNPTFFLIGNDGGLIGRPHLMTRISLTPGERVEILVNLTGQSNQTLRVRSFGSEIPIGTQGGPLNPSPPGTPSMESPLNGIDFDLLELRIGAPVAVGNISLPDSLVAQERLRQADATQERMVIFSSAVPGSPVGPFLVNDSTFNMDRIDFRIPVNQTELWTIHNQTVVAHPFHLHGFWFYVIDRYGSPVSPEESGPKDMVLVNPNEVVRIVTRFSEFADSTMPYMFHCHILTHEDEGMMAQFVVMPVTTGSQSPGIPERAFLPNPFQDRLFLAKSFTENDTISILSSDGREWFHGRISAEGLDTRTWPAGVYFVKPEKGWSGRLIRLP